MRFRGCKRWFGVLGLILFLFPLGKARAGVVAGWSPVLIEYWLKKYQARELPRSDPLNQTAQRIFSRIVAAAGRNPRIRPTLLILDTPGKVVDARALSGGRIFLTREAVRLCLYGPGRGAQPLPGGEDRLAFVLAHEVAHEVQYHPWANEQRKFLEKRLVEVKEFVTPEGKIDALEQQADQQGLIYAAAAGYDLRAAASVFEDWEPDPRIQEARKRYAAEYFRLISSDAELFAIALRLYQMGHYAEAIEALEGFRERYPGREVFNNLGLFHLRLALGYRGRYAPEEGLSFQRSVVASPVVEIKGPEGPQYRGGAGGIPVSPEREELEGLYQENLQRAVEYFSEAVESDPTHPQAHNNLGCAQDLRGKGYAAIESFNEALKLSPAFLEALNNRGVAFFGIGDLPKAISDFTRAIQLDPGYALPYNNLALLEEKRGRPGEARKRWEAYCRRDPAGPWTERIRKHLGWPAPGSDPSRKELPEEALGGIRAKDPWEQAEKRLGRPERTSLPSLGPPRFVLAEARERGLWGVQWRGRILYLLAAQEYGGKSALGVGIGDPQDRVRSRYGPCPRQETASWITTWVYPAQGIGFDFREGRVASWWIFEPEKRFLVSP